MGVAYDYGDGPYTVEDLHALPDGGKSFELVDGWLIELTPSTRRDEGPLTSGTGPLALPCPLPSGG